MHLVTSTMVGLLVAGHSSVATANPIDAAIPHVRPLQSSARALLATGTSRSATFQSLVLRLSRSDVIVYVDVRQDLPAHLGGRLSFLGRNPRLRFLIVQLNREYRPRTLVAVLGHELQ